MAILLHALLSTRQPVYLYVYLSVPLSLYSYSFVYLHISYPTYFLGWITLHYCLAGKLYTQSPREDYKSITNFAIINSSCDFPLPLQYRRARDDSRHSHIGDYKVIVGATAYRVYLKYIARSSVLSTNRG